MPLPAVGIFVGGRGRRMGGVAKGLLTHEGIPLVDRIVSAARAAAAPDALPHLYLVGSAAAYAHVGIPSLDDAPAGIGPIGGLRALLLAARAVQADAVALAVDLPHLHSDLVRRLLSEAPSAPALAPRQEGRWQPLFARYRPDVVIPAIDAAIARASTSLQTIFDGLAIAGQPALELELSVAELRSLDDWDRPSDLAAGS